MSTHNVELHAFMKNWRKLSSGLDKSSIYPVNSNYPQNNFQGPVVQSVVSLRSSLRVIPLTVLADSIYNILIFVAEKM